MGYLVTRARILAKRDPIHAARARRPANGALSTYQWRSVACALIIHVITIGRAHLVRHGVFMAYPSVRFGRAGNRLHLARAAARSMHDRA